MVTGALLLPMARPVFGTVPVSGAVMRARAGEATSCAASKSLRRLSERQRKNTTATDATTTATSTSLLSIAYSIHVVPNGRPERRKSTALAASTHTIHGPTCTRGRLGRSERLLCHPPNGGLDRRRGFGNP